MSSHHHSRFTNVALESRSTRRSMVQRGLALGGAALAGASIARAPARAQESQLEFMHWGSLLEKNEMAKTIEARYVQELASYRSPDHRELGRAVDRREDGATGVR